MSRWDLRSITGHMNTLGEFSVPLYKFQNYEIGKGPCRITAGKILVIALGPVPRRPR